MKCISLGQGLFFNVIKDMAFPLTFKEYSNKNLLFIMIILCLASVGETSILYINYGYCTCGVALL